MGLSTDLISQFVKATKDDNKAKPNTTWYGTIVYDGMPYVKLDGSDQLTPVSTVTNVVDGERVAVSIQNHTATVTGNLSSPSARTKEVEEVGGKVEEFEYVIAHKVTADELQATNAIIESLRAKFAKINELEAVSADIETLQAKFANLTHVTAEDMEVVNATIESLEAKFGEFTNVSTEDLEAISADITTLRGYTADFTYVSAEVLSAFKATIKQLETDKLSAKEADLKYANIDFANINAAAVKKLFTDSGIIKDLVVSEGHITGELVGVTIHGDLITAGTLKADKLVVRGSDGIYYKLNIDARGLNPDDLEEEENERLQNGLHGSVILARTITAEKVNVDDLVAFDATIGGFNITSDAIYSGAKASADNTTEGVYLDKTGQFAVGDGGNYLKYFRDEDGNYKLEISSVAQLQSDVAGVHDSLQELNTDILATCESIILGAGESYVKTGDYDEYRSTVASQLEILSSSMSMNFTSTMEQISNVNGDLQTKFTELYKYISFSQDGIQLGSSDSAITLSVDNDMIVFKKNGTQFGYWDGNNFHTGNLMVKVNERAQFGNFAFVPRSDGSLMFLKVGE